MESLKARLLLPSAAASEGRLALFALFLSPLSLSHSFSTRKRNKSSLSSGPEHFCSHLRVASLSASVSLAPAEQGKHRKSKDKDQERRRKRSHSPSPYFFIQFSTPPLILLRPAVSDLVHFLFLFCFCETEYRT